ncbi:MAG: hypothetical protein J7L21_01395 [Sulfurimonas sp.]|nr:hypothetical protein [Sulfurimonas sp.]
MKKSILALVMITTLSVLSLNAELKSKTGEFPQKEMKSQNKEVVRMVVEEISTTLPQVIDKYTTFTKITNEDLTLVYTYEINTGVKSDKAVIKDSKERMQKIVKKGICQTSNRFLNSQINISYAYINAVTKAPLYRFNITQKDCIGVE